MIWANRLIDHMVTFLSRRKVCNNNILSGFKTAEDRRQATVEYFLLSPEQQTVLARYLTKPKYTRSCLLCFGYIASCMVKDKEYLKKVSVESAISDCLALFDEAMPAEIDTEQVLTLLSIQQFQESLRMTKEQANPYFRAHSQEVIRLCVFAIVNNCSAWSLERSSSEILVEQDRLLGLYLYEALDVCSTKQIEELIDDWIRPADSAEDRNKEDNLLFRTLVSYPRLNSKYTARICDHLFKDNSITSLEAMELLQDDYQNKKTIKKYIKRRFSESIKNGDPQYVYAKAVFDAYVDESEAVPNAMVRVCSSQKMDDVIAGLAIVSLAAWLQIRKNRMRYLSVPFKTSKGFVDKLLDLVSGMDPAYFNIAVNCIADLYLLGQLDNRVLNQQRVLNAAITTLHSSDLEQQRHTEKLLGIMPLSVNLPSRFIEKYGDAYCSNLKGAFKSATINMFRILVKTQFWNNKNELLGAYRRLYLHAYEHRDDLVEEDIASLQLLKYELLESFGKGITKETSEAVLDSMSRPLPKEEEDWLKAITEMLLANPQTTLEVEDQENVANLLKFTEAHLSEPDACALLERTKIDNADIGSFLVLRWFVLLCRYSKSPEKIFAFYQQFAEVLNRPTKYSWVRGHRGRNADFCEYAKFLQTPCRLTAALELSQTSTLIFFVDQKELPDFVRHQIAKLLSDRLFLGTGSQEKPTYQDLLEANDVYEDPITFWEWYYEDRGVAKIATTCVPKAVPTILAFGYANDIEIGKIAVRTHPWNFKYLSAQLKQNL